MSDKITNENANNLFKAESEKPKSVHMSPYSSFYGSGSTSTGTLNPPNMTQSSQQQGILIYEFCI